MKIITYYSILVFFVSFLQSLYNSVLDKAMERCSPMTSGVAERRFGVPYSHVIYRIGCRKFLRISFLTRRWRRSNYRGGNRGVMIENMCARTARCTNERGGSFAMGEVHSTPSFHGLLIPNFTDNGRGAGFFLRGYTCWALLRGWGGDFAPACERDLSSLYFFFLSPLPFFHTHTPVFRRGGGEYGVLARMLMWDMQGLILWRVWGDPDINAIRAERQGWEASPSGPGFDERSCLSLVFTVNLVPSWISVNHVAPNSIIVYQ